MKLVRQRLAHAEARRRGAALLLSLLILLVLVAIVIQINVSTGTDARVARNDIGLTTMDLAIESALLQEYDKLKADGESAGGAAGAGAAAAGGQPAAPPAGGGAPGGQEQQQANDSRRDEWAQVQRTDINEIKLRILVQDEDSKLNLLNLLNPDEKEAQAAFDRIVRCLDLCRDGTLADIATREAEEMTRTVLEYMQRRSTSRVPRPTLLSDDEQNNEVGMPLTLEELAVLPHFDESLFRDYRDADDNVVHSIGSFVTVWSSLTTKRIEQDAPSAGGGGAGGTPGGQSQSNQSNQNDQNNQNDNNQNQQQSGQSDNAGQPGGGASNVAGGGAGGAGNNNGGWAVNVNTAPVAVLKALFDDREVRPRFWDKVVEYRNLEEEEEDDDTSNEEEEEEPMFDEFGNEIIERRIFESLSELQEVDGFGDLEASLQQKVRQLLTTQSQVFSIYVVARRTTSADGADFGVFDERTANRMEEEQGDALVRVVRSVVWRRRVEEEVQIVPILRWEYLDYLPFEVLDYPDEQR